MTAGDCIVPGQGVVAGAIHGGIMYVGHDISILMRLDFMRLWQEDMIKVNVLRVKVKNLWIMRGLLPEPILSL